MGWRRVVGVGGLVVVIGAAPAAQRGPAGAGAAAGHAAVHPDLTGYWYFGTATPLERPRELAGKATLTPEEAEQFERDTADRLGRAIAVHAPEWLDYGTKLLPGGRTSLIIDPPDGRVPALTPAARARATARAAFAQRGAADNPEERTIQERCLVFGAGPPLVPGPYNNNLQIVQTGDTVLLFSEMIHDARIVPLDGRPQLPASVTAWLGSSRGHWDGDTLTIVTSHFNEQVSFRGSDERLTVTERLHLDAPDTLRYEYRIEDPTAFTQPWTAAFTMTRTSEPLYEYACHEGNYGLMNILQTERASERESKAGK